MKTTGVSLALLVLLATTALAQIPRTISYQGRARANNQPVTGTHQMTLRLYTSATGGTAIFTENQNVGFTTDGIFTVAIGGATPGGVPESIPFDQQYWLGVTISGVNGGQELSNRYVLRSTPYSFRAGIADSAVVAGTTRGIEVPAAIAGFNSDGALLDIDNGSGSIGIQGAGSDYGVVSIGPMKTTGHMVAEAVAGDNQKPEPGSIYYDNAPIAWAFVSSDGTIQADFGVARVVPPGTNSPGTYEIVLDNDVELVPPSKPTFPAFAPVITPGGENHTDIPVVIPAWVIKRGGSGNSTNTIIVYMRDINGSAINSGFSIVVFGRPQ